MADGAFFRFRVQHQFLPGNLLYLQSLQGALRMLERGLSCAGAVLQRPEKRVEPHFLIRPCTVSVVSSGKPRTDLLSAPGRKRKALGKGRAWHDGKGFCRIWRRRQLRRFPLYGKMPLRQAAPCTAAACRDRRCRRCLHRPFRAHPRLCGRTDRGTA